MFRRLAELILILKWPIFLGLLLVTLITGVAIFHLQIDPSMETLFVKNSFEYRYYRQYSEKYGSDQMIAVAMATPDLFRLKTLLRLKQITTRVAEFDQVERVVS